MPLSQDEQLKFKTLYLQTARQYVQEIQTNLSMLLLGNGTNDTIDKLHLAAHSLCGQSKIMSYQSIAAISSFMEKIFKAKKNNELELSHDLLIALSRGANAMDGSLNSIEKDNKEENVSEIVENLRSLVHIEE